jgi:hypothetical protein
VRGGSTAAYSAVNVNRREAMANYSMYARSAGRHAQGPYGAGLGHYGPGGPQYGGVAGAQSMAQLEHQFGLMGYGNPNRGGHVNMGPGGQTNYPYGVAPAFARGGSAYAYGPSDAYGYGGDPGSFAYAHGAEYAMQMAQMQAHMMGTHEGTRQRTRTRQCGTRGRGRCGRRRGPPPRGSSADGPGGPQPHPGSRMDVPRADGADGAVPAGYDAGAGAAHGRVRAGVVAARPRGARVFVPRRSFLRLRRASVSGRDGVLWDGNADGTDDRRRSQRGIAGIGTHRSIAPGGSHASHASASSDRRRHRVEPAEAAVKGAFVLSAKKKSASSAFASSVFEPTRLSVE